jgi:AAA domain/Toprim-like
MTAIDYTRLMPDVARKLWGPPNAQLSSARELRWGTNGSRSVDLEKGTFYDHEQKMGGGVLDLLAREGMRKSWLHEQGFLNGTSHEPHRSTMVTTYDYHDASGKLIFQVCRFEPKTFKQRRPGRGGWIWNLHGINPVPYNLPELIEAVAHGRSIFIAEGEKDVEALKHQGLDATTNAGGAGKWRPEFAEYLEGADVIILPDNDDAGREHAEQIARSLHDKAVRVRVLKLPDLPPKGDISDWFAAGGTVEAFHLLEERALDWRSTSETETCSALGEWDAGDEWDTDGEFRPIPPRGWLLGKIFCRGFVSSLFGAGGAGKTALRYAQYLSLATGRSLTGEHVFQQCRVLVVSLEDGADELRRRMRAAILHHNIRREDVTGWLFLAAPARKAGKLMITNEQGRPVESTLAATMKQIIIARKIDLVALDPFVKTHSLEENSNSAIDEVMNILTEIACDLDIAVDTPHHISKGPAEPGNADKGRGASSQKDAGRLVYTLAPMTKEEAQLFGLTEKERRTLVRMDSAKVNIAPPMDEARWFRLVGVALGNATTLYPNGDEVQAVEPWTPPNVWAGLSNRLLNTILTEIDAGLPDGNRYSDSPTATDRAAWQVVTRHAPDKSKPAARQIINAWLKSGLLTHHEYDNPKTRKPAKGLRVDDTKRPS